MTEQEIGKLIGWAIAHIAFLAPLVWCGASALFKRKAQ